MPPNCAPPIGVASRLRSRQTVGYVAPFLTYIAILGVERWLGLPLIWSYAIRLILVSVLLVLFSRPYLSFRPGAPAASIAVGMAVFLIWVGPDLLFGYRHFWPFENLLMGSAVTSISPALKTNVLFLTMRVLGASLLVPVMEELFWRGWLMRWLIDQDFLTVPIGTYAPSAFWIVALLFASEHGSFWEVGLVAGIVYNWWIIRTKNLADCILAHLVTNAILAAYVVAGGQWQYWL
ncbi:MAG: CAAX prenyl protease-related protein [Candidatus Sulfopaludibacter sp.]|nr:CAAX prenyl protease-related protein [Candidatus Sulfopaludibacter sp.]